MTEFGRHHRQKLAKYANHIVMLETTKETWRQVTSSVRNSVYG